MILTEAAKNILQKAIEAKTKDSNVAVRLVPANENSHQLEFVLDEEKKDDLIIKDESGKKLLLINKSIAEKLKGIVMDYKITSNGRRFKFVKVGISAD